MRINYSNCFQKNKYFKILNRKLIAFLVFFLFGISLITTVYADDWDGLPFPPGTIDNPPCLPSQTNCDVVPSLTSEVDPVFSASSAFTITGIDITNLSNLSGVNTGDNAVNSLYSGLETSKQDALGFTPVSNATTVNGHALSSDISVTATDLNLGNVTNESKTTMFTSPTFTGTVSGITGTMVGLGNVPNLSFSGSNTGDETQTSIKNKLGSATSSADGYLTSSDWNIFSGKQPAGSYITLSSLSGTSPITYNNATGAIGFTNPGYITSFTELDPIFSSWLSSTPPLYSYTETDPTIYSWAKATSKPTYTATEVGLGNVPNLSFSGSNTGDDAVNSLYSGLVSSQWLDGGAGKLYYNSGNVGIGTATPGELLSLGLSGTTGGIFSLAGLTSGKAIIQTQAIAGTPTLTLPTTTGTLALTSDISSSALLLDQTTPQTIINGTPVLGGGLDIGSPTLVGRLNTYATLGADSFNDATDFVVAGHWTLTAGWESTNDSGTELNHNVAGITTALYLASAPVVGNVYKVVINLTATVTGGTAVTYGGVAGTTMNPVINTPTTYTWYVKALTVANLTFTPVTGARFTINDISIQTLTDATGDVNVHGDIFLAGSFRSSTGNNAFSIDPNGITRISNLSVGPISASTFSGSTGTFSGAVTTSQTLTTTPTNGFVLTTGSALVGTPIRISPSVVWAGSAWNTTLTAATKANTIEAYLLPVSGAVTSGALIFANRTVNGIANSTEIMRMTTAGNVGIGTTAPAYKLDVNGSFNATSVYSNGVLLSPGTGSNWTVNGSDIYRSVGNVGIGTASPSGTLDVHGSTSDNTAFSFQATNLAGTTLLAVRNDGNVGIGTATPSQKLTITGGNAYITGAYGSQTLSETNFATHAQWDTTDDFNDTGGNAVYVYSAGVGTLTQTSVNLATAGTGSVRYEFTYTVSALTQTGEMSAVITSAFASVDTALDLSAGTHTVSLITAAVPGDFVISATSDTVGDTFTLDNFSLKQVIGGDLIAVEGLVTGGGATGIKVLSSGLVGIGTVAPTKDLTIRKNVATLRLEAASSPTTYYAELVSNYNTNERFWLKVGNGKILGSKEIVAGNTNVEAYLNSYYGMVFTTGVLDPVEANVRMLITQAGNVGIGTTAPGSKLDVLSNLRISGNSDNTLQFTRTGINANYGSKIFTTGSYAQVLNIDFDSENQSGYGGFNITSHNGVNNFFNIIDNGNVGIGTTGPISLFEVKAVDTVTGVITVGGGKSVVTAVGEINSQLDFRSNDASVNNTNQIGGRIASVTELTNGSKTGLAFYTFKQAGTPQLNEWMRISNDGNVGIGTTTPVSALNVAGTTGITWGHAADSKGLVTIGTGGTDGSSLFVNTPSKDSDFQSGLGITGSYASLQSVININAYGVHSATTTYGSNIAFSTTKGQTLTEVMRLTTDGNVGIGNTAPGYLLHVGSASTTDATVLLRLQDADSTCDFTANSGSPSCGSDLSLKKNIFDQTDNLTKVLSLRPVTYNWLTDGDDITTVQHGFIAQEVADIMPELVTDGTWIDGSTKKFLQTTGMTPYIVGAIQEMNLKLESLAMPIDEATNKTFAERFFDKLIAWLGSSDNGIEKICVKKSDGTSFCADGDQLEKAVNGLSGGSVILKKDPVVVPVDPTCTATQTLVNHICTDPAPADPTCTAPQVPVDGVCKDKATEGPTQAEIDAQVAADAKKVADAQAKAIIDAQNLIDEQAAEAEAEAEAEAKVVAEAAAKAALEAQNPPETGA